MAVTAEAGDAPVLEALPQLYGRDPRRVAQFQRDMQTNANFLLCSRAGAVVSTVVGQSTRDAPALQSLCDLQTYRTIMRAQT